MPGSPLPSAPSSSRATRRTTSPPAWPAIAPWVAEIVVVVNDCTDGTEEIARHWGARVVPHAWENFREQKAFALGLAAQEWVLAIDADERVSPELRDEIAAFVAAPGDAVAAESPRLVTFLGRPIRHGDWYPDRGLRLVRRGHGRWTGLHDHCKLVADGPVRRLKGDLHHDSFPTLASLVRKIPFHADNFVRSRRETAPNRRWSLAETLVRALWRFVRSYFLRRGFLDAFPGLVVSLTIGYQTFIRYARLYEAERTETPSPS